MITSNQLNLIANYMSARISQADPSRPAPTMIQALTEALAAADVPFEGDGVIRADPPAEVSAPKASDLQVGGDHYKGDQIQHFEFCQRNRIPWCESAAIKYLVRHKKKNGVEDLDKAIHYVLLARQIEYPSAPPFRLS